MSGGLAALDATAQAELVRSGTASPVELVEAAIERIEELNPALNAVIHELFDQAREAAAGELPQGPFRGVPLLLKDLGPLLAGAPLHMGMRYLKQLDFRPPRDSELTERFKRAGFVIVAKTNTPELGIQPTTEPVAYGPTRNPWDPARSPGGSSGGSAAAVASGMAPVAHANDGGGSIRIPASACGLVGLKPTRARISLGPVIGDVMSGMTSEGVLTRSVRDTAAILDAIAGDAPGDPYVAPEPSRPYAEEVGAHPGRLRIGLWTDPVADDRVGPETIAAATAAARLLDSLGHEVEPADLRSLSRFAPYPAFVVRWAAGQAATLADIGRLGGRPIEADDVEPLTWALAEIGRRHSAGDYLVAVGAHQAMARRIAAIMESQFDLLLSPTTGDLPPPLGALDDSGADPMDAFERARPYATFTAGFNASGQPAISLPLYRGEDGLPIGVQLAAAYGREDLLIRVASQLEAAQPWSDRRPRVFAGEAAGEAAATDPVIGDT